MRMQFLGAAREVTGSCTLLHANGYKILVDFGMEQGKDPVTSRAAPKNCIRIPISSRPAEGRNFFLPLYRIPRDLAISNHGFPETKIRGIAAPDG